MSGLSDMQAKRLAARLTMQAKDGSTDTQGFREDLLKYHAYQQEQRAAGKQTRGGKHSAQLAPLIAALPEKQRALGLHVSAEHAAMREHISEEVAQQLAPLKRDAEELLQLARGEIPEKRADQTPAERKRELDQALLNVLALRAERKQMVTLEREDKKAACKPPPTPRAARASTKRGALEPRAKRARKEADGSGRGDGTGAPAELPELDVPEGELPEGERRSAALPDGRRARGEAFAGYAELLRGVAPILARHAVLPEGREPGRRVDGLDRAETRETEAEEPKLLHHPMQDPVWPVGGILYLDDAFDPKGLGDKVSHITSKAGVKAQHAYTGLGSAIGSFNFGVVPQMGLKGAYYQTLNMNTLSTKSPREELRNAIWQRILPTLERVVPRWPVWKQKYREQCPDIPPLTVKDGPLPWNGEQMNVFHAATRHKDRTDARELPCLIVFCGAAGGTLRVHGKSGRVDVETKPGGLLLFDSTFDHEVLAPQGVQRATDGKGNHATGRISYVWMANRQQHTYKNPEWIRAQLREKRGSRASELAG